MSAARVGSLVLISCGAIKSRSGGRRPNPIAARTGAPRLRRKANPARAARRPTTRKRSLNVAPARDSTPPLCLAASEENAMLPAGLFFTAHDRRSPAVEVQGIELSLKFLSGLLTTAQEAGGEEAVEARKPRLGRLKMQWQCPQFAVFVQDFGQTANLVRCYRNPNNAGLAAKQRRNLHFVFFGFNRTGAIDDHSARFHQCDGFVEKARLKCRQRRDIAGFFDPGDIRVTPDRSCAK